MTTEHNEETLSMKKRRMIISLEIFIVIFFIALIALTIKSNKDYEIQLREAKNENYIGLNAATDILNGWLLSNTGESGGVDSYDLVTVSEYSNQVTSGEDKYTCYDFTVKYTCTDDTNGKCLRINDNNDYTKEDGKYIISGSLLTKGIKYNLSNTKCSEQK